MHVLYKIFSIFIMYNVMEHIMYFAFNNNLIKRLKLHGIIFFFLNEYIIKVNFLYYIIIS